MCVRFLWVSKLKYFTFHQLVVATTITPTQEVKKILDVELLTGLKNVVGVDKSRLSEEELLVYERFESAMVFQNGQYCIDSFP